MPGPDAHLADLIRLERLASKADVTLADLQAWIVDNPPTAGGPEGLIAITLGEKRRDGAPSGEIALVHQVDRKLPASWLGGPAVPERVEVAGRSIPTDVVEWQRAGRGASFAPPVRPETSIGNRFSSRGTLGAIVRHRASGGIVALSACHVLGKAGDGPCLHPAGPDGGRPIGHVRAWVEDSDGDAAICGLGDRSYGLAGAHSNVAIQGFCAEPALCGTSVVMVGVASGWRRGVVKEYRSQTVAAKGGRKLTFHACVIVPDPHYPQQTPFTQSNDSGACWHQADWQGAPTGWMVGLHVGGAKDGTESYAMPAHVLQARLGLEPAGPVALATMSALPFAVAARDGAILRGLPDPAGLRLSLLANRQPVSIVSRHGDWAAVDLVGDGAIDGFVLSALLKEHARPLPGSAR